MISFHPYASSSAGNLYTVSDGQTTVMIECGLPWRKVRQLLNFKTADIAGVLLSHSHLDHCKGALEAARNGMDVYASIETLGALQTPHKGFFPAHRFHTIQDGKQFSLGTWRILPFATVHDCEGSLGYLMVNGLAENFLFLTDSQYSPVRFPPLSVIALECNFDDDLLVKNVLSGALPSVVARRVRRAHLSLKTVKDLLLANDRSRLREVHLLHLSNGNSNEMQMIREIQEAIGVPVYVAP